MLKLNMNEVCILEGALRYLLGLITEDELKNVIYYQTNNKSQWEGGLSPLLKKIREHIEVEIA